MRGQFPKSEFDFFSQEAGLEDLPQPEVSSQASLTGTQQTLFTLNVQDVLSADYRLPYVSKGLTADDWHWLRTHSVLELGCGRPESGDFWSRLGRQLFINLVSSVASHAIISAFKGAMHSETFDSSEGSAFSHEVDLPLEESIEVDMSASVQQDLSSLDIAQQIDYAVNEIMHECDNSVVQSDQPGLSGDLRRAGDYAKSAVQDELRGKLRETVEKNLKKHARREIRKVQLEKAKLARKAGKSAAKEAGTQLKKSEIKAITRESNARVMKHEMTKLKVGAKLKSTLVSSSFDFALNLGSGQGVSDAAVSTLIAEAKDFAVDTSVKAIGNYVAQAAPKAGDVILKYGGRFMGVVFMLLESESTGLEADLDYYLAKQKQSL
jgi:hypothetical protein